MGQLFGTSSASVDEKGRLPIPSALRKNISKEAQKTFIIVRGTEGCLFAYPKDEWLLFWRGLKRLTPTVENTLFVRRIVDGLKESSLDAQGRIMISPALRELGGIQKEVKVVAMGERIEIWDVERHRLRMSEGEAIPYDESYNRVMIEIERAGKG